MPSLSEIMNAATGKAPLPEPEAVPATLAEATSKALGVTTESAPQPINPPLAPNEEIQKLAEQAAKLADVAREASAASNLVKNELFEAMQSLQLKEVKLDDRAITIKTSKSKSKTLKALKSILGDETAKKVWDALPETTSQRIDVPKPTIDEPEA